MIYNATDTSIHTAVDRHIHTKLCCHASGEMEEYVLAAICQNLDGMVFLEHMEEGIFSAERTWLTEEDFDCYFSEGRRLQEKYKGQLSIGLGVECGYNPDCSQTLISRLGKRDWDEIGISCHFIKPTGSSEHLNLFSRKKHNLEKIKKFDQELLLDIYFDTLLEAVTVLPGTKLCHLDGALRFLPNIHLTDHHLEKVRRLLLSVKKRAMAVEINSSGIPIRGEQFPTRIILEMAISEKVPLVFGSDSHRPEEVGRHYAQVKAQIAALSSKPCSS